VTPDWLDGLIVILVATLRAGTPLVYAALGELITERSGVLNLGVEGMMLVGAVAAIAATLATGSYALGLLAAIAAGAAMALLFGFLTLTMRASQVPTGLALTIFGIGLSTFVGHSLQDKPLAGLKPIDIPGLTDLPVVGPLLFGHDILVYGSLLAYLAIVWFLYRSKGGLVLRAVGESAESADAIGYPVIAIRYAAVAFGGAMAGVGGAYLTLVYTPMWAEQMTAGRGWIALALVVFATWKPGRVLLGAYLFGGVTIAQLYLQGAGLAVSSHLLSMLPYIATIAVLAVISRDETRIKLNAPAALGRPFFRS
jgi:ABC-type uncharacterized transport system permease subunit